MLPRFTLVVSLIALNWSLTAGGKLKRVISITAEIRNEFVNAHNEARASVLPSAADMTKVEWDEKIAKISRKFIKKCRFMHSPASERTTKKYPYGVGENLFVGMTKYHQKPSHIVGAWDSERKYYDIHTTSCMRGKMCGHYTQVVWSTTRKIGCAMAKCSHIDGVSWNGFDLVAVCHYGPPGNWRGEQPYKIGTACSECPADRTICVNDFCSSETEF